uniref:Uncharacterized protein n=1 Tax=Rangifer tarandus platyrhynchus TaxID=3082113 RepID=A0ACB0EID5_RANTA|nr:unnamed protein product [Rangifer tarandus platyrhynchus]
MFLIKMVLCRAITRERGGDQGDKHLVVMQKAGRASRSLTCENKPGRPRARRRRARASREPEPRLWVAGPRRLRRLLPSSLQERRAPAVPRATRRPCRPLSLLPVCSAKRPASNSPESWYESVDLIISEVPSSSDFHNYFHDSHRAHTVPSSFQKPPSTCPTGISATQEDSLTCMHAASGRGPPCGTSSLGILGFWMPHRWAAAPRKSPSRPESLAEENAGAGGRLSQERTLPATHPGSGNTVSESQAATSPPASEVGGNAGAWLGRPLEALVTDHCPQPRDYRGSERDQPAWSGLPPCSGAQPAALPGSAPAAGAPGGPEELRTENRSEVSLDLSFRPPQRAGPLGDRRWPFPEGGRLSMARVPGMGTPAQPARGVGLLCGQHPTRGLFRVNHLERDLKLSTRAIRSAVESQPPPFLKPETGSTGERRRHWSDEGGGSVLDEGPRRDGGSRGAGHAEVLAAGHPQGLRNQHPAQRSSDRGRLGPAGGMEDPTSPASSPSTWCAQGPPKPCGHNHTPELPSLPVQMRRRRGPAGDTSCPLQAVPSSLRRGGLPRSRVQQEQSPSSGVTGQPGPRSRPRVRGRPGRWQRSSSVGSLDDIAHSARSHAQQA